MEPTVRNAALPAGAAPCPRCGGSGWELIEGGGAGSARPCDCRARERLTRLMATAGVPPGYRSCRFETFNPGNYTTLARALATTRRYVEDFHRADGSFAEAGLLFEGPTGVGKTHLAVAALLELIRRHNLRGRFVDFTSLIFQIQSTFDASSEESKHEVLEPVMNAELLVVDELGAQQPTPWVSDVLYLLLNHRYTRRLPTFFTTNYTLAERASEAELDAPRHARPSSSARTSLAGRIHETLLSRLHEMAVPVVMESKDHRREVGLHRLRVNP